MNIFILLAVVLFIPVVLFIAYLILSSCLGDRFRARIAGVPLNLREGSYRRTYGRNIGASISQGGWEQIEMQNVISHDYDDDQEEGGPIELRGRP